MIISQTPLRISFFGGGTDYPAWFREHGGAVISTSINKYAYLTVRHLPPFFEHKHRVVYSIVETVQHHNEIKHPVIRAVMEEMKIEQGLEIHYDGDLPAKSGLGSSSTFTVGLLNTLSAMKGLMISKRDLAKWAVDVEQNLLKEVVGCQDQIAAALGGFNRIDFHTNGDFTAHPVIIAPQRLQELNQRLLLFFTGTSRFASSIAESQVKNFKSKTHELNLIRSMVDEAQTILQNSNRSLDEFGRMLHESWLLKRSLSNLVSTPHIDEIYDTALAAGALGGKVLGAGGGGFMLFDVPLEKQPSVRSALRHLIEVDYRFESGGSQIILYNPDKAIFRRSWNE